MNIYWSGILYPFLSTFLPIPFAPPKLYKPAQFSIHVCPAENLSNPGPAPHMPVDLFYVKGVFLKQKTDLFCENTERGDCRLREIRHHHT